MGEFDLIRRYFTRPTPNAVLGVGDDCALLRLGPGMQMAISTDMLVADRHFFADVDPRTLGHKALAVNLSDLAACGARPLAFTLALSLPDANPDWLHAFSQGLLALADAHDCELVGGDTTRGPLNICITVFGEVPAGAAAGAAARAARPATQALLRGGAQAGDDLYVSGTLGDARLALEALQGRLALPDAVLASARQRLECPTPRVALGMALRGIASAAADISDGLLGDLGHILERSAVGATVDTHIAIELLAAYVDLTRARSLFDQQLLRETALRCVLGGGDDYELVFTAPVAQRAAVQGASIASATPLTRIGKIDAEPGLRLVDAQGATVLNTFASFDHFNP
ncbi:thiamine-phosphate kinase [Candidatus Aalborgicola defluviihabitans]|uniref:thiamine-phosphate kinase n=1 Tax=Candidatus Aalborgicola defluviihabitans TaxID=3386187 RepID=UPI003908F4EB|nr:thiamine-phosphate kinase [Burkholderiales bacterium]